MTVAAWLGCGVFAAALAWLGHPDAYPDGPAIALAASLCGSFLGGALVTLVAGDGGVLATLSVCAATAGAIAMLALAQRASGATVVAPIPRSASGVEAWSFVADPVLATAVLGLAVSDVTHSRARGVLAGVVVVVLFYHPRVGLAMLRRAGHNSVRQ